MEGLAKWIKVFIVIALFYYLFSFFLPVLFALLIAVLLNPIVKWVHERLKINRKLSSTIVITSFFASTILFLYFFIGRLIDEVMSLSQVWPNIIAQIDRGSHQINDFLETMPVEAQEWLIEAANNAFTGFAGFLSSYAQNIFGVIADFPTYFLIFMVFILSTYFMSFDLPKLRYHFLSFFSQGKSQQKADIALIKMKESMVGFIKAHVFLSFVTFGISFVALTLLQVEFVIFYAFILFIVDLIPLIGTIVVLLPWGIYAIASGNFFLGIGLLSLMVFILFIRRTFEPKLLSNSLGLSPLLTILSLYFGFVFMGFIGMIVGLAVAIITKSLKEANLINLKFNI